MTWEIAFVLILLILAIASFILEKIPSDLTAITLFIIILLVGLLPVANTLPSTSIMLSVFANPAPVTVASMFIISAALEKCGAIEVLAVFLEKLADLGYRCFLLVMILGVAIASAFINNTPIVVVLLPVILSLSKKMGIPASKFLIPLSYASIFGGICTLVGTSTNILASSIIEAAEQPPLGMFETAWIGVPLLLVGSIYLIFFANQLLPVRETLTSILSEEERKEYITEAYVQHDSSVIGKTLAESGLLKTGSARVLEIIRDQVALFTDLNNLVLSEGDRLIMALRPSGVAHARMIDGVNLAAEMGQGLETIAAHEGSIVEGVIGTKSTITGKNIRETNFRQRYRMIVLAIHRGSVNLREKLEQVPLEFGDTLLMMGTDTAIEDLRKSDDILLLDRPTTPAKSMRQKMPIVFIIIAAIIISASLNLVPIVAATLTGVGAIFLTGCLKPNEGYAAIEWSIIFLIYGMLGVGMAMYSTGTATFLVDEFAALTESLISDPLKPYIMLAGLYLCTTVLTEFLSNNATIVLMAPVAIGIAESLGVDPRPFIITAAIASSASFSTPIGYQTNTFVFGVGGYRFSDFYKIGLPLNIIFFIVSMALIPRIWSF